jgi:hypothetical protein
VWRWVQVQGSPYTRTLHPVPAMLETAGISFDVPLVIFAIELLPVTLAMPAYSSKGNDFLQVL